MKVKIESKWINGVQMQDKEYETNDLKYLDSIGVKYSVIEKPKKDNDNKV